MYAMGFASQSIQVYVKLVHNGWYDSLFVFFNAPEKAPEFGAFSTLATALHCTLHTAHCSLLTAHCSLLTAHCTLHTAHCTLHTAHCTPHTALCNLLGYWDGIPMLIFISDPNHVKSHANNVKNHANYVKKKIDTSIKTRRGRPR
jgi:hypothetical protein